MAEAFTVIAQRRTVQARPNGAVQDVVELTARTSPSGVTFTRIIPVATWQAQGVHDALAPIAENIEAIMRDYPVVGAAPAQEIDTSGLISNAIDFTLTTEGERGSPAPAHTTVVRVPVQALRGTGGFAGTFAAAVAALEHAAGM